MQGRPANLVYSRAGASALAVGAGGDCLAQGRPSNLVYSSAGASALAVGAGGGCLDFFPLIYYFSSFSLSRAA